MELKQAQAAAAAQSLLCVHKFKMLKLDQFLVCFQNFGQGAFFRVVQMFIHFHSAYMHTSVSCKSCGRTPKNAYTTDKTVLDVTSSSQNSRISCLSSIVYQKFNVKFTTNIIVQSFEYFTYLNGREIWGVEISISTSNEHASNVGKTNVRRPK